MKEKLGISMTAVRPLLWKVILLLVLTAAVQLFQLPCRIKDNFIIVFDIFQFL